MAKSIRISDELYELAAAQGRLMNRSLAQQFEHWASLGQALEQAGSLVDVQQASLAHLHERDRLRVRTGRVKASSLHAIPAALARDAELIFPDETFPDES